MWEVNCTANVNVRFISAGSRVHRNRRIKKNCFAIATNRDLLPTATLQAFFLISIIVCKLKCLSSFPTLLPPSFQILRVPRPRSSSDLRYSSPRCIMKIYCRICYIAREQGRRILSFLSRINQLEELTFEIYTSHVRSCSELRMFFFPSRISPVFRSSDTSSRSSPAAGIRAHPGFTCVVERID